MSMNIKAEKYSLKMILDNLKNSLARLFIDVTHKLLHRLSLSSPTSRLGSRVLAGVTLDLAKDHLPQFALILDHIVNL